MKTTWKQIQMAMSEAPAELAQNFVEAYDQRNAFWLLLLIEAAIVNQQERDEEQS